MSHTSTVRMLHLYDNVPHPNESPCWAKRNHRDAAILNDALKRRPLKHPAGSRL